MNHGLKTVTAVAISVFWACTPQSAPPDMEAALASLRETDARYSQMGASKDIAGFMALYASDATAYVPDGPTIEGAEGIRAFISEFMQDPAFAVSFRPIRVEVSPDGSMGYTINSADITASGPDGAPITERVRDLHIWRKEMDGSWKLVVDIWNAEQPAAAAGG